MIIAIEKATGYNKIRGYFFYELGGRGRDYLSWSDTVVLDVIPREVWLREAEDDGVGVVGFVLVASSRWATASSMPVIVVERKEQRTV